ncbi:cholinesterase-like [Aulostomus maculatus]
MWFSPSIRLFTSVVGINPSSFIVKALNPRPDKAHAFSSTRECALASYLIFNGKPVQMHPGSRLDSTLLEGFSMATHFALFLVLPLLTASLAQDDLLINTKSGKVQGKLLSVVGGDTRAFLGIPYGKPPVGQLRFRAPEPAERWDGVKDATKFSSSCYQLPDTVFPGFQGAEMWNPNTPLSEDCLYLNVWSPRLNQTQLQASSLAPVLVWIYGGGFMDGTSSLDIYDGRFLSRSEGVVVVSMNYRVGALGFLSLPDNHEIRGNAGLLDQRLALRWVANNIAAFGGDPSKVTLFGESAGAASVGFHLLSPGSHDLFQKAVMQSGSPNAPWATISRTDAWERSVMLATLLGCPTSHPARLETCLQKADPGKITSKQYDVFTTPRFLALSFGPLVDGDFLPDKPEVLLQTSKLPKKDLLLGLNKDEGTYFLVYGVPGFNITGQSLITRKEFEQGVALIMADAGSVTREAAVFQYTNWADESNRMANRDSLGSLVGDQLFVCPLLHFAQRYSQRGGKTFLYLFDHRSSTNPWPAWMGVMHGDEIEFVLGRPLNVSWKYSKNEVNMTKKFMKHWANFARTSNPGIDGAAWPSFTPEHQEYVTLNYHHPEQRRMMRAKECHLWRKLIPNIQKVSDNLQSCVAANGIMLCFDISAEFQIRQSAHGVRLPSGTLRTQPSLGLTFVFDFTVSIHGPHRRTFRTLPQPEDTSIHTVEVRHPMEDEDPQNLLPVQTIHLNEARSEDDLPSDEATPNDPALEALMERQNQVMLSLSYLKAVVEERMKTVTTHHSAPRAVVRTDVTEGCGETHLKIIVRMLINTHWFLGVPYLADSEV